MALGAWEGVSFGAGFGEASLGVISSAAGVVSEKVKGEAAMEGGSVSMASVSAGGLRASAV